MKKKVLGTATLLALTITIGGPFAWFTAKNKAVKEPAVSDGCSVSVREEFAPPKQWVPGKDIIKKAGVINNGNVDAFVKLTLSNNVEFTPKTIDTDRTVLVKSTPQMDYSTVMGQNPYIKVRIDNIGIGIYIKLNAEELKNWSCIGGVFYYNRLLQAGETSGNLITAVTFEETADPDVCMDLVYKFVLTAVSVQTADSGNKTAAVYNSNWDVQAVMVGKTDVEWK